MLQIAPIRLARESRPEIPDLGKRGDEIGDLNDALRSMTDALWQRLGAIESFAADVAHEIKNPLTSLRSAIETLDLVTDPAARERLLGILKNDVKRLDRLVTDISNASRLDAELSRDAPKLFDLDRLLRDVVGLYQATARPGDVTVRYQAPTPSQSIRVSDLATTTKRVASLGSGFRISMPMRFAPNSGFNSETLTRAAPSVSTATVTDLGVPFLVAETR